MDWCIAQFVRFSRAMLLAAIAVVSDGIFSIRIVKGRRSDTGVWRRATFRFQLIPCLRRWPQVIRSHSSSLCCSPFFHGLPGKSPKTMMILLPVSLVPVARRFGRCCFVRRDVDRPTSGIKRSTNHCLWSSRLCPHAKSLMSIRRAIH